MIDLESIQLGVYTVGEKPLPLTYPFQDNTGAPIDLTGYTARFQFKELNGSVQTRNATVSAPAVGEVTYTWTAGDLGASGQYEAEFWVGNTDRLLASVPIVFTVRESVGSAPSI